MMKKSKHGGKREGAGRNPGLYQTKTIRVPVDLLPAINAMKKGYLYEHEKPI